MIPISKFRYILLFLSVCSSLASAADVKKMCTNGYTLKLNKCWKLYESPSNKTSADEICRADGGAILSTVKNAIDNGALSQFLSNTTVDILWLGMTCTGLTIKSCMWTDQTSVQNNAFTKTHPNDKKGMCVFYTVKGDEATKWTSVDCSEELPFVCELPTTTSDNGKDCDVNYDNSCYHRMNNTLLKSFSNASDSCNMIGSNLPSVHSYLENRFIQTVLANETDIWLGGVAPSKDHIIWTDRSPDDYNRLSTFENGKNCVEMPKYVDGADSSWNGSDCSEAKAFICKRAITQK